MWTVQYTALLEGMESKNEFKSLNTPSNCMCLLIIALKKMPNPSLLYFELHDVGQRLKKWSKIGFLLASLRVSLSYNTNSGIL